MAGNYYSYKRVSTQDKQNFNRQEKTLEKYSKQHNIEFLIDFEEKKSGKNIERTCYRNRNESQLRITGDSRKIYR